jgi:UDP-N-acetylmuramoyl-L-alanyl-D-glutamate--2,6-diaminopimelate ligase
MRLERLLGELDDYELAGDAAVKVTGLAFDSRRIEPGHLFVTYVGRDQDGHVYIPDAIERGAVAVVGEQALPARPAERGGPVEPDGPAYVQVPDGREALARLAAAWYGHPGREMTVIGVTGTDGKTTTVNLIQSILAAAGRKTGMVSTVNALIGDSYQDTGLHVTTPDALQLQSLMARMVQAGTEVAILETTSHGLAQHRVTGAEYDVAIVTNITHEHLDEHGTWEQYCADKARLFDALSTSYRKPGVPKVAVLNADDASYPHLRPIPADFKLSYALDVQADVTATEIHPVKGGAAFTIRAPQATFEVRTPLGERFNVYNILAAASAALALDVPVSAIQEGVAKLAGVSGRMERLDEGQDFAAIVDFAHTPAALESALRALRLQAEGRLIAVFGCAGLRDVYKREMMGRVAGELADVTVITAEDPRTEDLGAIIEQIAHGCRQAGAQPCEQAGMQPCEQACSQAGRDYICIPDRAAAIAFAVQLAGPGDIVVAAGKGHERSMCFGTTEYPWSDHQAMRAALLERLGRPGQVVAPRLPTSTCG